MSNTNTNTFRSGNETIFLVNILNTMYNDNLRQINSMTEILNNLNNSNNQIRNLLIQLLNGNQANGYNGHTRRNQSRRFDNNSNNFDYNNITTNGNSRNVNYLIGEYTFPLNTNRQNNNRNRVPTLDSYARNIFENFFQPVEIYPTQSQIENATRRVRYCDISRPVNTSCPISMDEFNDNDMVMVIRHCGHVFHTENIMNWFRSNCRCPVCRYDIRDYNSNASTEYFTQNSPFSSNLNNNASNNFYSGIDILSTIIFDPSGNNINTPNNLLASYITNSLGRSNNNT